MFRTSIPPMTYSSGFWRHSHRALGRLERMPHRSRRVFEAQYQPVILLLDGILHPLTEDDLHPRLVAPLLQVDGLHDPLID